MGLFGNFETINKKPKLSIYDMAESYFDDEDLLGMLKKYLMSRKEQRNLPSKISWETQLQWLLKVPVDKRVNQVETAIVRGWRQVAFKDSGEKESVTMTRTSSPVMTKGF